MKIQLHSQANRAVIHEEECLLLRIHRDTISQATRYLRSIMCSELSSLETLLNDLMFYL